MATTKKVVSKKVKEAAREEAVQNAFQDIAKVVTPAVSKEPEKLLVELNPVIEFKEPTPEDFDGKKSDRVIMDEAGTWKEPKAEVTKAATEPEPVAEVPIEEAILTFVESRNTPEVRLNEFLKSLYGLPQAGAKQKHEHITELRYLRSVLASLDGKLTFTSRQFLTLGNTKYEGVEMKAKKITLNDINIVVKK